MDVVTSIYGPEIRQDVLWDLASKTFSKLAQEKDLKIVSRPNLIPEKIEEGKDAKFKATFEVYPEISLAKISKVSYTNFLCEITDEDLQCLKTHNVSSLKNPKNYLILHETGDEVIPSQYTFDFYQGCYFIVRSGGSHSFDSFAQHLQSITDFLQLSKSK